jgi:hypothetical protein
MRGSEIEKGAGGEGVNEEECAGKNLRLWRKREPLGEKTRHDYPFLLKLRN